MNLPITCLLTAAFVLLAVALSLNVSLRRLAVRTELGAGGDEMLNRRMRAHGNFSEYAPLALILLGLVEYSGAARLWVLSLALLLLLTRLMHAYGILFAPRGYAKLIAMVTQHGLFALGAVWLAYVGLVNYF